MPLQRARQRDPEAVEGWRRQAKRGPADIYFGDESGFRTAAVQGPLWQVEAQPPIVQVLG